MNNHSDNLTRKEYSAILDTMADGLFTVDSTGIIKIWNRAMERLTGYTSQEAVGKLRSFLQCSDCRTGLPESRGEVVENYECLLTGKDGRQVAVLKNARPLPDDEGSHSGYVVCLTDISAVKKLEHKIAAIETGTPHHEGMGRIIGSSKAMQAVYERIGFARNSGATVLIYGETGTGKELVAEAIHEGSARKDSPLVKVNCSALPETLLESELFGHVKGAFTGAIRDKPGRFEIADGGTVFLDEIGDISPLIQLKLLRVLQEKQFERVGESITRKADIRIITATNRNLRRLVAEGTFRDDLYYRLRVFTIHVPSLHERQEDIPALVSAFIKRFNLQTGKNIRGVSLEANYLLMDYCWPGNVRELENAIEHAFVTCQTDTIGPFDLPLEIRKTEYRDIECRNRQTSQGINSIPATAGNDERETLIAVLKESGWNKALTARRLGITRTTVWRKMKQLGIPLTMPEQ